MRGVFYCLLILVSNSVLAQSNEWKTWYFGNGLGMSFTGDSMVPLNDSKFYANYGVACLSYPSDGSYMMVTDGKKVFSKDFQAISGKLITSNPVFSFFVPDPQSPLNYYLFVVDTYNEIQFIHIDHSNPSGIGVIDMEPQRLRGNADHHFTAVKQLYGNGYWLITHTKGNDEFQVFAITKEGVSRQPIRSNTGSPSNTANIYVYGNMVTDKKGERLLHCMGRGANGPIAEILKVDKRCGTIEYAQSLSVSGFPRGCQGAFSMNDSFVYVVPGGMFQFALSDTSSKLFGTFIEGSQHLSPKIMLAPDGIIYLSRADRTNATSKVAIIEKANTPNPEFFFDKVNLSVHGYRYVENFPSFIMDWTDPLNDLNNPYPKIYVDQLCLKYETRFDVSNNFLYDSLSWEFGDGIFSKSKSSKHQFSAEGTYSIKLNWYLCGQQYSATQTIQVVQLSDFGLGMDTLLCYGTEYELKGLENAQFYQWNTGEKTSNINVKEKGLYWLRTTLGICVGVDSIYIDFRESIFGELRIEPSLCPDDSGVIQLNSGQGFEDYRWTPLGDSSKWIEIRSRGNYFSIVYDFHGCSGEGESIIERRCPVYLEFPNSFTPNGDGINDYFYMLATDVRDIELKIYNRWGAEIHSSTSIADTWDGTVKGKAVPEGVYVVIISYSGYENGRLKRYNRKQVLHLIR